MNILVLSGLDPSGGAGILRDTATIYSQSSNTLPLNVLGIVTVSTVQNSRAFDLALPVDSLLIKKQFEMLIADYSIDIIKIGLIDNAHTEVLLDIVKSVDTPLILDPILASSTQHTFSNLDILHHLLPYCTLITPNVNEFLTLTGSSSRKDALTHMVSKYTLVTAADTSEHTIEHVLYQGTDAIQSYSYEKLPHKYHGSGCTLSSLIAAHYLSDAPEDIITTCKTALDTTYAMLQSAHLGGCEQLHPSVHH